jgi:hypothetical protein
MLHSGESIRHKYRDIYQNRIKQFGCNVVVMIAISCSTLFSKSPTYIYTVTR